MKIRFVVFVLTLVAGLWSCEPPATFEVPQPVKSKNLAAIPKRFTGTYQRPEGGSTLFISQNLLLHEVTWTFLKHRNQLDSGSVLKGNLLYESGSEEPTPVTFKGDTLIVTEKYLDTIFTTDKNHVLKKFKGIYFLNSRYGSNRWLVSCFEFEKNKLKWKKISSEKDAELLREITAATSDSASIFNPNRRQIKQFLKDNGLSDASEYVRVM